MSIERVIVIAILVILLVFVAEGTVRNHARQRAGHLRDGMAQVLPAQQTRPA